MRLNMYIVYMYKAIVVLYGHFLFYLFIYFILFIFL